jgi:hypothetical protein
LLAYNIRSIDAWVVEKAIQNFSPSHETGFGGNLSLENVPEPPKRRFILKQ